MNSKPSDGLEPSTPSYNQIPLAAEGNPWHGFRLFLPFPGRTIFGGLRGASTAPLHNCSTLERGLVCNGENAVVEKRSVRARGRLHRLRS